MPAANIAVAVSVAYGDALKACSIGDHERALKAANKILHLRPKDEPLAFRIKIVALIQLERYNDAISHLTDARLQDEGCNFVFEHAYALYRLNKPVDALACIDEAGPSEDARCIELRAQLLYRLERFTECRDAYISINQRDDHDEFDIEHTSNRLAATASCSSSSIGVDALLKQVGRATDYEVLYNAGCCLATTGQLESAVCALDAAEEAVVKSSKSGSDQSKETDDDDLMTELHSIRAQKGYVLQLQHANQAMSIDGVVGTANCNVSAKALASRSRSLYNSVLRQMSGNSSNQALLACVSNNMVCWNGVQNIFDSRKRMKAAALTSTDAPSATTTMTGDVKLSTLQRQSIAFNNALLAYYANNTETVRRSLIAIRNELMTYNACQVDETATADLIDRITMLELSSQVKTDVKNVPLDALKKLPVSWSTAKRELTLCQVRLDAMDVSGCIKQLLTTSEDSLIARPGIVSLLLALLTHCSNSNDVAIAEQQLFTKLSSCLNHLTSDKAPYDSSFVLRRMAAHFASRGDHASAIAPLLALHRKFRDDTATIAKIVMEYAKVSDMANAEEFRRRLPKLTAGQCRINVADLVNGTYNFSHINRLVRDAADSPKPITPRNIKPINDDKASAVTDSNATKKVIKKKKKRKVRLPQNMDPNNPPDPERWLPRRERSGYKRPRRDKRRGDQGNKFTGAQGGNADSASAYDYTNRPAKHTVDEKGDGKTAARGPNIKSKTHAVHKKKGGRKNRL